MVYKYISYLNRFSILNCLFHNLSLYYKVLHLNNYYMDLREDFDLLKASANKIKKSKIQHMN